MDRPPLFPDGATAAVRELASQRDGWMQAYADLVADIRGEVGSALRSFDPCHGWRGTMHRVLLQNSYADIGITTDHGRAAIWIAERTDRDYRRRCGWIDLSADARRWLTEIAPLFHCATARLGCVAALPEAAEHLGWLEAA